MFSGEGSLLPFTEVPWSRRSAMSIEVRFEFFPEAKYCKYEVSTPHTLFSTNKGNSKTGSTESSS